MSDEPVRVVFHLDQDSRLVGVFCSAVEHQALSAGLEGEAGAQLAKAAGDVCREAISTHGRNGEAVNVTMDRFVDRIEIAIHCHGQAKAGSGPEKSAVSNAHSGEANRSDLLSRVDRVLYHTDSGVARTTLVKYLPSRGAAHHQDH